MMQVLPIILVAVVMAVDGGLKPLGAAWPVPAWAAWLNLWLPPALLCLVAWWAVNACGQRLRRGRVPGPLIAAGRIMRLTRWLIIANQCAAVLVVDGLGAVRQVTGDLILIDEAITILPALLALVATWWIYYPIEQMLLDASLVRRLDEGETVYPTLTRRQYVMVQTRLHLLLLLLPVLVIAGVSEAIDDVWAHWKFGLVGAREALTIAAAATVFLFAPLFARIVLDTESLPAGELRNTLSDVCKRHRVGVRDLLLWKTNGSMINAAVMGLIAPLRYVLITDALLETLREREVRAVMAHEVGHVRRRHMLWMVACLMACFVITSHAIVWPLQIAGGDLLRSRDWAQYLDVASVVLQLALGLWLFGWICRRFERQADTFATQHLSGLGTPMEASANITLESVNAMRSALETIAELNTVDPSGPSWRHGSIRWRQQYLESIIGRPVLGLPIDRLIKRVKFASMIVLVLGVSYEIVARQYGRSDQHPESVAISQGPAPRLARLEANR